MDALVIVAAVVGHVVIAGGHLQVVGWAPQGDDEGLPRPLPVPRAVRDEHVPFPAQREFHGGWEKVDAACIHEEGRGGSGVCCKLLLCYIYSSISCMPPDKTALTFHTALLLSNYR